MTSQNFSSKCLSLDALKVRVKCGLMALLLHKRCTVWLQTPLAFAIERVDHWVLPLGGRVASEMICSLIFSSRLGFRPLRLRSLSPCIPSATNRFSQALTDGRLIPTFPAVSSWLSPSARHKMIRQRRTILCSAFGRATMDSSSACC